jgi:hypothetical protein
MAEPPTATIASIVATIQKENTFHTADAYSHTYNSWNSCDSQAVEQKGHPSCRQPFNQSTQKATESSHHKEAAY